MKKVTPKVTCYYCGAKRRARLVGPAPQWLDLRELCWKCQVFNVPNRSLFPKEFQ